MKEKKLTKAERIFAENKARINAAASSGTASEKTLHNRGYSVNPSGSGPTASKAGPLPTKKRRKRRSKR